jgi:hypothetical protein
MKYYQHDFPVDSCFDNNRKGFWGGMQRKFAAKQSRLILVETLKAIWECVVVISTLQYTPTLTFQGFEDSFKWLYLPDLAIYHDRDARKWSPGSTLRPKLKAIVSRGPG